MTPEVSVVITTYNRSDLLLKRSLPSVLAQTFKNLECIIVDDGSADDTEAVVREVMKKDNRVRYVKKDNGGQASARNVGIREARGNYVAFTDDDDSFDPRYIETAVVAFTQLPEAISYLSSGAFIRDDVGFESYYVPRLEPYWRLSIGNGWVFRREVFTERHLYFDESVIGYEDLDLHLRFHEAGEKGAVIETPLRTYYAQIKPRKQESWSTNYAKQAVQFETFFKKHNVCYEHIGKEALGWLYFSGAMVCLRAGKIDSGRKYLKEATALHPTLNSRLYYAASLGGRGLFLFYDRVKNRSMRFVRSARSFFSLIYIKARYKRSALHRYFPSSYEWYYRELHMALHDVDSVLDVGCGADSPLQYAGATCHKVGVDLFNAYLERSKAKGIHDEYHAMDITKLTFPPKSFDVVLASDVIEHLEKEDGYRFLEMLQRIARKKVIIYTPNGFLPQKGYDGNAFQEHLSGWTVHDFKENGFTYFRGMDGLKGLRGEGAHIKWRPKSLWLFISNVSERFVLNHPRFAHALLAIKHINERAS
jgi:glycosyltransferase involved in cell wall biosynthesis